MTALRDITMWGVLDVYCQCVTLYEFRADALEAMEYKPDAIPKKMFELRYRPETIAVMDDGTAFDLSELRDDQIWRQP